MTQIDQIIADALAGSPETHVAILAREVVRLREAPAVVMPEPTMFDVNREYFENFANVFTSAKEREAHKTGFLAGADWFRSRAIPADSVPGGGMVAVSREERLALGECSMVLRAYSKTHGIGVAAIERLDAIRANHGGADHV